MKRLVVRALHKLASSLEPPKKYVLLEDEYVRWLKMFNSGMQDPGNLYLFDYVIRNLPSEAPILEIGSASGLSANIITYLKGKYGKRNRLISCDRWEFERDPEILTIGDTRLTFRELGSFVKENYIRNIKMFSKDALPFTIELFSDEFFAVWRDSLETEDVLGRPIKLGGPISFCYIDGNHTYDYAKRDFLNTDEFLEENGFILFDDSQDDSNWEVKQVIAEVQASNRYQLIAKNPNYLFKKMRSP